MCRCNEVRDLDMRSSRIMHGDPEYNDKCSSKSQERRSHRFRGDRCKGCRDKPGIAWSHQKLEEVRKDGLSPKAFGGSGSAALLEPSLQISSVV